jgi:mono/diheme cytochrome c family protein
MKKALKWIGIVLGGLIVLLIVVVVGVCIAGESKLSQSREVLAETIPIPTDEAALARGAHLINATCKDCHGADLSGEPLVEDPAFATIYGTNITGLAESRSDADLVRAIRHGVGTDGRRLIIMPSEAFIYFSEEDLGSVIAYLKTLPRTGDDTPSPQLGPVGRVLMGTGALDALFPASYIDHNLSYPAMPEVGANVEYGEYLSRFCLACHGTDLAGGQPPDPDSIPAPDLRQGSRMDSYSEADFIEAFRTGATPYGTQLDPFFMPWESFGKLDDDELKAMYMYLSSLPPQESAAQ